MFLLGAFDCLELILGAFAGTHVCDCGIAWQLMVLGVEQPRAGARVFRGGAKGGGGVVLVLWVCDVVVTPFDLRSLEMAHLARIDSLLLLCLG